jgi:uncharacterized protein (DUF433 family)
MEPITAQHIESRPDKCGGKPCIRGTRIRVQDIYVWHDLRGLTADQIVDEFPQLTSADVHAALSYFWDHEAEIRQQMRADEDFVAKIRSAQGPGLLDRVMSSVEPGDWLSS